MSTNPGATPAALPDLDERRARLMDAHGGVVGSLTFEVHRTGWLHSRDSVRVVGDLRGEDVDDVYVDQGLARAVPEWLRGEFVLDMEPDPDEVLTLQWLPPSVAQVRPEPHLPRRAIPRRSPQSDVRLE